MQHDTENETAPVTAFIDASDNLSMRLDQMGAVFAAIQRRAEGEGSSLILILAHLGAELTEQADRHYEQLSKATKEWRTRDRREENE